MKKDYTHISIVLDRSGSMQSCVSDTVGGFNQFIADQNKAPGEATLTLVQFDDVYEPVHAGIDLKEVPPLTFLPRGSTALLDAIGKTIVDTGKWLEAKVEDARPEHVIFVILTDGMENASREYARANIFEMIRHQESQYGWQFVFIGANQDAIAESAKIGIRPMMAMDADAGNMRQAYASASKNLHAVRSGASSTMDWSKQDREDNRPKPKA